MVEGSSPVCGCWLLRLVAAGPTREAGGTKEWTEEARPSVRATQWLHPTMAEYEDLLECGVRMRVRKSVS